MKYMRLKKFSIAIMGLLAFVGISTAQAQGIDIVFDTTPVDSGGTALGPFTFTYDEITITSIGTATITQIDTNSDGVIGPADDFVEIGLVGLVNFQNNGLNVPVTTTGINFDYELLASFTLVGTATVDLVGDIIVSILPVTGLGSSSGTVTYDETVDSAVGPSPTSIASFSGGSGDCNITAATTFTEGSCKVSFDFASLIAGVFKTTGGVDLSAPSSGGTITLDINVDNLSGISPIYPGGPGSTQVGTADHDGSLTHQVPEPATVALLGIGLLGLASRTFNRRHAA